MDYTSAIPSPVIFRKWAAIAAIAGALERRCWTESAGRLLYPNMIILLVAKPGIGKGMAITEVQDIWKKTGKFNVAPNGMTKAAFVDNLSKKPNNFQDKTGMTYMYNALLLATPEFGTLLPEYDHQFLNVINDVYDCNNIFDDATRGGGTIRVDRPHIFILSGTQPSYLGNILPETAYGMGFTSRIIMIYHGKKVKVRLFGKKTKKNIELQKKLLHDLKLISGLNGEFEWETEAEDYMEEFNADCELDEPKHPKLEGGYNARRVQHVMKITMAECIANGNEMVVKIDHARDAHTLLLEAENIMPEIFKEMIVSSDKKDIDEIHQFMFSYCRNLKVKAVPEHKLTQFMMKRIPVNKIQYFMEYMDRAQLIKMTSLNVIGKRKYEPLPTAPKYKE